MTMENVTYYLHRFADIIWNLLNKDLISISGVDISLLNLFSFVFFAWAARSFFGVMLDRKNGEV